jgi:hypothetical protein
MGLDPAAILGALPVSAKVGCSEPSPPPPYGHQEQTCGQGSRGTETITHASICGS